MALLICSGCTDKLWIQIAALFEQSGLTPVSEHHSHKIQKKLDKQPSSAKLKKYLDKVASDSTEPKFIHSPELTDCINNTKISDRVFVLHFFTSPEFILLKGSRVLDSENEVESLLAEWKLDTTVALKQKQSMGSQILFVNLTECIRHPDKLLNKVSELIGQDLKVKNGLELSIENEDIVNLYFGLQTTDDSDELDELYETAKLYGDFLTSLNEFNEYETRLRYDYPKHARRALIGLTKDKASRLDQISFLDKEVSLLKKSVCASKRQLEQCRADQESVEERVESVLVQSEKKEAELQGMSLEVNRLKSELGSERKNNSNLISDLQISVTQNKAHQIQLAEQKAAALLAQESAAALSSENQLCSLQVSQLQSELETYFKKSEDKSSQLVALKKELVNLKENLVKKESENKLLSAQAIQLQEKLESNSANKQCIYNELLEAQNQLAELKAEKIRLSSEFTFVKRSEMKELEAEKELALLQVCQLQEELEHYYSCYINSKELPALNRFTPTPQLSQVFKTCSATKLIINEHYAIDGYEELKLSLFELYLGDGRFFNQIDFKLFVNSNRVGLEFRPNASMPKENEILNWHTEFEDEYGPYVVFIPDPNDEQKTQQQLLSGLMNASDKILVHTLAENLAEFMMGLELVNKSSLEPHDVAPWRVLAVYLQKSARQHPVFLASDNISLNEEMVSEGYEHLWIRVDNLLLGERFFPHFEFKLVVTDLSDSNMFASSLSFEFRCLPNGQPPMQAWPPAEKDEYGEKLIITADLYQQALHLEGREKLSYSDNLLLSHLINHLPEWLEKLASSNEPIQRSWDSWQTLAQHLRHLQHVAHTQHLKVLSGT